MCRRGGEKWENGKGGGERARENGGEVIKDNRESELYSPLPSLA